MADKGSSSKSKSSKRKRDKTSSKKKSRRKESKKLRRIHDSASSYSDHDSLNSEHSLSSIDDRRRINKSKKRRRDYSDDSSDSDSLSPHDNGAKRRKVRESRVSSKSTKKRSRKRSVSPKGDAHVVRKRKRLDKDRVVKPIKKSSKKKPKKYLSCSSSSDSESCSTPQNRSSPDGKQRRSKAVLDNERGGESYKPHKKSKIRSPSISSGGHSDRAMSPVINNTRRLRSVIAVVVQPDDEGENRWETDPQKEEIFYDKNDYPSPKSVDSNERVSKTIHVENVAGEEVTELTKSRIDESDRSIHRSEGTHINNLEKEKESYESVPVAALGGDVLESILRQKALENLKKFKGKLQTGPRNTDPKINKETDVNELTNQSSSNARETGQINGSALKGDICIEAEPGIAEQTVVAAILGCSEEDKCSSSHAVLDEPVIANDNYRGAADPSLSSDKLISEEHSLEQNDEAKDGSQFKKKTMSVMRGGEVVQVSYKVYIPKKTPALARRQFRR